MDAEATIYVAGLLILSVIVLAGLVLSIRSAIAYQRAERNLLILLNDDPEKATLAELILQNPSMENIQKARELVIRAVNTMSKRDQREISRGLYQDSVKGRARYVAKLVTDRRSGHIRRIPADERVTG